MNGVKCSLCKKGVSLPIEPLDYKSPWRCLSCQQSESSELITSKLRSIETDLDNVPDSNPAKLENILSELECKLHENHYLITDTRWRLIDIYGHQEGFHYNDLGRTSRHNFYYHTCIEIHKLFN